MEVEILDQEAIQIRCKGVVYRLWNLDNLSAGDALKIGTLQQTATKSEDSLDLLRASIDVVEIASDLPREILEAIPMRELKRLVELVFNRGNVQTGAAGSTT